MSAEGRNRIRRKNSIPTHLSMNNELNVKNFNVLCIEYMHELEFIKLYV